jgi:hypothetical protein
MKTIFGRFSSATGFKEVFAAVQVHSLIVRLNAGIPIPVFLQGYATNSVFLPSLIGSVVRGVRRAKVAPFVVASAVINMVNHFWRLLSGHKKVSNAVRKITFALPLYFYVPLIIWGSCYRSSLASALRKFPNKIARIWTVLQDFTDRFGYKFRSHVESPLSVVRGLVTAITSTPILTQRYSHV